MSEPQITLALGRLYDAVVAQFDTDGTDVACLFGWRASATQKTRDRRIVWIPGDESGAVGMVGSARFPGRNPRPIGTLYEMFRVEIEAVDPTNREDERANYQATRELFDAWYRAVYLAAVGNFTIESSKWTTEKTTRRNGTQLVVVCTLQSMIPDAALETAPTDSAASITPNLDGDGDGAGTGTNDTTFSVTKDTSL